MTDLPPAEPPVSAAPSVTEAFSWAGLWRRQGLNIIVVALSVSLLVAMSVLLNVFNLDRFVEDLELKTYDARASLPQLKKPVKASPDIVIVKFDDLTLTLYENEYGTWPWSRQVHADLIHFMNRLPVKMLAFDMMFTARKRGEAQADNALINAFKRYPNVYLSMNLDNNLPAFQRAGKSTVDDLTVNRRLLAPLALDFKPAEPSEGWSPFRQEADLDENGFYQTPGITFNHPRLLMSELMAAGERIGIINHVRDRDGISRGNPLVFRLQYDLPRYTTALPIVDGRDAWGRSVDDKGRLLDDHGQLLTQRQYQYFPYLSMRMMLDEIYPGQPLTFGIHHDALVFGRHRVPLNANGLFRVSWYSYNFEQEQARDFLANLPAQLAHAQTLPAADRGKEIKRLKILEQRANEVLAREALLTPYPEISASKLLMAIEHERSGRLNEQDRALMRFLKNKVVFVGTTAVSTHDIKSTPIGSMMPGVLIQAHIFDNLRQNNFYIQRVSDGLNYAIAFCLSLLSAYIVFRMRSVNAGLLSVTAIGVVYVTVAFVLFSRTGLWINIVFPMLLQTLAVTLTYVGKYIVRDRDYRRTYMMATTDSMTSLYNYRFFNEHMANSIERSKRFHHKFSLIMIDIDFFKKFNDTYGHQAGDEVLRCVARKLKSCVRTVDVVARYGGEEMAVILDRANEQEALEVARKLVASVAAEAYPIADGVFKNVTISVGVATYPTHGLSTEDLLEFADKGLYRAKENGRNQVGAQYDDEHAAVGA